MTQELTYTQQEEIKALARQIHQINNQMSSSDPMLRALAEELAWDHRTLQQGIMRDLVVPLLRKWAVDYADGNYDDRNKATVEAAYRAVEAIDQGKGFPAHFPFI